MTKPPSTFSLTDMGNAARLAARHGQDLRYCYDWRTWLVWNKVRWERDATGEVMRRAKETAISILEEARAETDKDRRAALTVHATRSESDSKLTAMVNLARSEPGIAVRPHDLDRDPYLLNVANGTIDLKTGELLPHRREDMITKLARISFNAHAVSPVWDAFLDRAMDGSSRLTGFLQRAVGYSLTGDVSEQKLVFEYGGGANGKTTFINTILNMMGDYARSAAPELLLVKRGESHPTERADLFGARFVSCVETEGGRRLAETFVKQATGGDRQVARRMRQDFFEFEATHHIWLAGNHKPVIRGTDHAMWRRILLVPFTVKIPDHEQDKKLEARLRVELPGILSWAVRGCLEWQAEGLCPPEEVTAATQAYREEMDVLGDFLKERCVLEPDGAVSAARLYAEYLDWCQKAGEKPAGTRAFGMALTERSFNRKKSDGNMWWHGVSLASERHLFPAASGRKG